MLIAAGGCNDQGEEANIGPEERPDNMANNANIVNDNDMTNDNMDANRNAAATNGQAVDVADITGNPNNYIGKTVTVSGWVERSYYPQTFRLDEDSVFTGGIDNDLLVVGKKDVIPADLKSGNADARVRVTGTVQKFVAVEIERDYDLDLTGEIENEFKNKTVLVANSVEVLEKED